MRKTTEKKKENKMRKATQKLLNLVKIMKVMVMTCLNLITSQSRREQKLVC